MNGPRSLRAHLFIGAVLWTIGLFAVASVAMTQVMLHHPSVPRVFHGFLSHATTISVAAALCMIAGFVQVRRGLSAVDRLRARLTEVREGRDAQVSGAYPGEVQPLVNDLNALLAHRDRTVRRALAKAGDLAHGLKTPLSVLAHEAERADAAGHHELAAAVAHEVDRMRRQVPYHLAQARAAAAGSTPGARCMVKESADGLARTLLRLHADRAIVIDVRTADGHAVRGQREDLDEMLGNLLDNACKWARSRVVVASSSEQDATIITVDDDGPGLAESLRDAVLRRGVRADEAAPGSGLGLAIVRDLAELHGGSISLHDSPEGGLRARLRLPSP